LCIHHYLHSLDTYTFFLLLLSPFKQVVYTTSALPATTPMDLAGRPTVASASEAQKNTKDNVLDVDKFKGKALGAHRPSTSSKTSPSKPTPAAAKPSPAKKEDTSEEAAARQRRCVCVCVCVCVCACVRACVRACMLADVESVLIFFENAWLLERLWQPISFPHLHANSYCTLRSTSHPCDCSSFPHHSAEILAEVMAEKEAEEAARRAEAEAAAAMGRAEAAAAAAAEAEAEAAAAEEAAIAAGAGGDEPSRADSDPTE
jgi:hypothetical protein